MIKLQKSGHGCRIFFSKKKGEEGGGAIKGKGVEVKILISGGKIMFNHVINIM